MGKICCFFGHSKIENTDKIKMQVTKIVKNLVIEYNFDTFYFGGFGKFDELCWEVVTEIKNEFNYIKRIFCLYDERHLIKRPRWLNENDFEEFIYLDLKFDWWYTRIYFRNTEIIKHSDFARFYVFNKTNSGAYKIYEFCKKIKKNMINIYSLIK